MRGNNPMFWLKLHVLVNISVNSWRNYYKPWHGPLQMMIWIITNYYKSPQVDHDMNHHKSQITTNHHKPWHKPPWTMTETSTKHDMNHYKSPQNHDMNHHDDPKRALYKAIWLPCFHLFCLWFQLFVNYS